MSPNPMDPGDPYSQIPLFREIQRVLLNSAGPVNWELARQVAIASSVMDGEDRRPSGEERSAFEDAVRVAELQVAELTGLTPSSSMPDVTVLRRSEWVESSIDGLKDVIEPVAARSGDAFAAFMPEQPEDGAMMAPLSQLSPLFQGMQTGSVLGYLAQRVFSQHDIAVPRPAGTEVGFVAANIATFEREWHLDPMEFRQWVALHEVSHRFAYARPWVRGHLVSLLTDYASTLQLDLTELREKLEGIDMSDPQGIQEMFGPEEGLCTTVLDDEQRLKLARIQAFIAAAEGFSEHVTRVLAERLLSSFGKIYESLQRHRESGPDNPFFGQLLGIEIGPEHTDEAERFCGTVVQDSGEEFLSRMWDSPEAMPSMPEFSEPSLWMARTG